jgi:hypothetical protein
LANQGSAKQNRPADQSVSIQRSRAGRDMSRWDAGSCGPFAWMRQMRDQLDRAFARGAITDSAKATFNNGVLEIVLQAPSFDVRRGRRVEIKEGTSEQKSGQQSQKT